MSAAIRAAIPTGGNPGRTSALYGHLKPCYAQRMHASAGERLTIITVTYNSSAIIERFLAALPTDVPLIVSDNDSRDDTLASVRRHRPDARALAHSCNLGYGSAANRALEQVTTPFALLLNPDIFLHDTTLMVLLDAADRYPGSHLFGAALVDAHGGHAVSMKPALFENGHRLFKPIIKLGSQKKKTQKALPTAPQPVGWICGALMLFRLPEFSSMVGLFDENIFLYFEETDLCLRAVRAGCPPLLVPGAVATHLGGLSSDEHSSSDDWKQRQMERSRYYLARKYPRDVPSWLPPFYRYYYQCKYTLYRLSGNRAATSLYHTRMEAAREGLLQAGDNNA